MKGKIFLFIACVLLLVFGIYIISLLGDLSDAIKPLTDLTPVFKIIAKPFKR